MVNFRSNYKNSSDKHRISNKYTDIAEGELSVFFLYDNNLHDKNCKEIVNQ